MSALPRSFRVTHPFHPQRGESFDLIRYARSWGQEVVEGRRSGGEVLWFPLGWTDAVPEDPFVVVSKGRSWFRVDDLVRLVALIEGLRG